MMKRILVGLVCLLALPLYHYAQDEVHPNIYIGANVGLALQDFSEDSNTLSYQMGGTLELQIRNNWEIKTGLAYAKLGSQTSYLDITNQNISNVGDSDKKIYRPGAYQFQYLMIPLNVKYNYRAFYAATGIDVYMFYKHLTQYGGQVAIIATETRDATYLMDDIRKLNAAFTINLGYNWTLNEMSEIYVEPQFSILLSPIFKNEHNTKKQMMTSFIKVGVRRLIVK